MPDVKMPDGTIIRNVPEGITRSQLMARYAKTQAPAKSRGIGDIASDALSSVNEALIGGVEGVYNAASAVTDPIAHKVLSLINGEESANAAMSQARGQRKAVSNSAQRALVSTPMPVARTVGQIGGSLVIPLPGKKLQEGGKLARGAYRAMQGAVGGAAVRDVGDESAVDEAALGAGANVILPPILRGLANTAPGKAVGKAVGSVAKPIVNYLTGGSDEAIAALQPPQSLAPLGREAEARAARFEKLGVKNPTTGMVTRDPNAFSFEQNNSRVAGVGDDLQAQIKGVADSLIAKGREIVGKQGGAKGEEATGIAVQKALDAKRTEMQRVTGRLYDEVRDQRGDEVVGRLNILREKMSDPDVVDNAVFDQMREGLLRRMDRLGLTGKDGSLSQGVTVKQAEELRKFIRELGSTSDPAVRMMRSKLIDALDDDVVEAVGDDAFKAARASAKARFDEFGKTFAGKIADEGIAPERLTKRVLSDTTSLADLRAMRKSLLSGTDDQIARGQEAWRGIRGQAIGDLLSRSMNSEGKLLGGQLERDFLAQQAKLRELLDPADYKELRRLVLASRDATVAPPQSSVNHSGTAITLANMFQASKPAVRDSWLKLLTKMGIKHGAAFAAAGPPGNIALAVGEHVASSAAEQKAAELLMRRVRMAQSPEETAAAIEAMKRTAKSNPVVADFLQKYGASLGGSASAVAGESR